MNLNLDFSNKQTIIINCIIIIFCLLGIASGYKKGFLESTIRFIGSLAAFVIAYLFKNPVSVYLYENFPFFKLTGIFKGITVINILIYELIAFIAVFILCLIALKVIAKLTGLLDKILSFVFLIGLPNKILGAIAGFLESIITVYFIGIIVIFFCNFKGYTLEKSLLDNIIEIPILEKTFGNTTNALEEISSLAKNYKEIESKEEYNYKSLEILLKYKIITPENAENLIDEDKIKVGDYDYEELLNKYKENTQE